MKCLILRLEAPLMSFGGVLVDQRNPTDRFPGRALLAGLIANALGWNHAQFDDLNDLQERLRYAARWDVVPEAVRDYHTVELGQAHLKDPGWTTRGRPEHRKGSGDKRHGTHQRYRHYWADGVLTVALGLKAGEPGLDGVEQALCRPARPLFLGRKTCLPSGPILRSRREVPNLLAALQTEPADPRAGEGSCDMEACWPPGLTHQDTEIRQRQYWTDDRDWHNQVHVGQRPMIVGIIREVPPCT
jgi:CRISPR system Cascade subunit CasD